jgi:ABC-type multidrug transport system fused ATPase/permease subunit
MSLLDLLGVVAIGLLGAVSVSDIQSQPVGSRINFLLSFIGLQNSTFQTQALVLSFLAVVLLVGRTILSIFFTRRIIFFLSYKAAEISANLIFNLLSKSLISVQEKSTMATQFAVTRGVDVMMVQVIATCVVLVADVSLLLVMGVGLLYADPTTAIGGLILFAISGLILHQMLQVRAGKLGVKHSDLTVQVNEKIGEVISSYREIVVRSRTHHYAREIGRLRLDFSETSAEMNFLPYVSKYVIESTVILGGLLMGCAQFLLNDVSHAVTTLAIFFAAGSRIAPAVLRIQQGSMQLRTGIGQALPTLELIDKVGFSAMPKGLPDAFDLVHEGFKPEVIVSDVNLRYPNSDTAVLSNVTLSITAGSTVAVVGPSGSGKTSLIDIILGVVKPDTGLVSISGLPPLEAAKKWPGAISYVPQDVVMTSGTVRENVSLGYKSEIASDELVFEALTFAQLKSFVGKLPKGLESKIGQSGGLISGGERQRVGVARAIFTKPRLLVLDEATSALDSETESSLSAAIEKLKGSTTVIMIAHRLSTVQRADLVVYIENGQVLAKGTFDEVRATIPNFNLQAEIMGIPKSVN